ncbi:hypothetical protein TELCIR_12100 [Teladorsagia circumcincta]|uniref:Coiled-coil domain-containing protein n=1 Tax=Teladorsagia circumcincta TaxID=45464 RepID=A0A2G9U7G1_TELCI|nr:hypothetical protein TELCIR_12100 [Teladorsagia circumcincta]
MIAIVDQQRPTHYNRNREDRRLVGDDTKRSIKEQMNEDQAARQRRLEANQKIAESDEELARRLQREFEEEVRRQQEEQAQRDAELAQRLAFAEQSRIASSSRVDLPVAAPSYTSNQPSAAPLDQPLIDITSDDHTTTFTNTPIPALTNDILTPSPPLPTATNGINHDRYENVQMDPFLPGPSASSAVDSTHGPPLLEVLHPTNPFLLDIAAQETLQPSPLPPPYRSEFGLPPPSNLALGKRD